MRRPSPACMACSTGLPAGTPDPALINAIAPALVVSGMVAEDQDASAIPVGRLGSVEEVTQLAMTMLTNSYLTGKVFLLDGGIRPQ